MKHVAIIGAGIVGMATAVRLQETRPSLAITVIADNFDANTTSGNVAGIFRPPEAHFSGRVDPKTVRRWLKDSWTHYSELANSPEADAAGVFYITGYNMENRADDRNQTQHLRPFEDLTPNFRKMTEGEWDMFGCRRNYGVCYTCFLIHPKEHLRWLRERFQRNGGKLEQRRIHSFEELAGVYDVVINCTGLRAQELVDDPELYSNRGQVIRVHAPWIKHYVFVDNNCYIIPCLNDVFVGGTRQDHDEDADVRPDEHKEIWKRACSVLPSLKGGKILSAWTGLRPQRKCPRIETESKHYNGKQIQVVHHYGHSSVGVGLSWGTAGDAVAKVVRLLGDNMSKL